MDLLKVKRKLEEIRKEISNASRELYTFTIDIGKEKVDHMYQLSDKLKILRQEEMRLLDMTSKMRRPEKKDVESK